VSDLVTGASPVPGVRLRDATFADLTTLRVGGRPAATLECFTVDALAHVVVALDAAAVPLLVVGGGSNLVVGDDVGELVAVVPTGDSLPEIIPGAQAASADGFTAEEGTVIVRAFAGTVWDDLVDWTVENGLGGLECLSGIPGTVGAAPVQNIGAYGAEVSGVLHRVQLLERTTPGGETEERGATGATWVTPESLELSYRYSNLKFTARAAVTAVEFRLTTDGMSVPLRFGELARGLGVRPDEVSPRRPVADVRASVLALRRGKGMVLEDADHDTWSAGSFFTNPVVSGVAARDAVIARVSGRCGAEAAETMPCYPVASPDGAAGESDYKFSAPWLIERAGFPKGWGLSDPDGAAPRASLSTKHTLALTNRGSATSEDIVALAAAVRDGVREAFGVALVPEPVWIGATLPE